jgi:hypothetical protein
MPMWWTLSIFIEDGVGTMGGSCLSGAEATAGRSAHVHVRVLAAQSESPAWVGKRALRRTARHKARCPAKKTARRRSAS